MAPLPPGKGAGHGNGHGHGAGGGGSNINKGKGRAADTSTTTSSTSARWIKRIRHSPITDMFAESPPSPRQPHKHASKLSVREEQDDDEEEEARRRKKARRSLPADLAPARAAARDREREREEAEVGNRTEPIPRMHKDLSKSRTEDRRRGAEAQYNPFAPESSRRAQEREASASASASGFASTSRAGAASSSQLRLGYDGDEIAPKKQKPSAAAAAPAPPPARVAQGQHRPIIITKASKEAAAAAAIKKSAGPSQASQTKEAGGGKRQSDMRSFLTRARQQNPSPIADVRQAKLTKGPASASPEPPVVFPHRRGLGGPSTSSIAAGGPGESSMSALERQFSARASTSRPEPTRKRRYETSSEDSDSEAEQEAEEIQREAQEGDRRRKGPRHTEPLPLRGGAAPAVGGDITTTTSIHAARQATAPLLPAALLGRSGRSRVRSPSPPEPGWARRVDPFRMNEIRRLNGFSLTETQVAAEQEWLEEQGLAPPPLGGARAQALAPTPRKAKREAAELRAKAEKRSAEEEERIRREDERRWKEAQEKAREQEEEVAPGPPAAMVKAETPGPITPKKHADATGDTPSTAYTPSERWSQQLPEAEAPIRRMQADTLQIGPTGKKIYAVETLLGNGSAPGFGASVAQHAYDDAEETQFLPGMPSDTDSEASPLKPAGASLVPLEATPQKPNASSPLRQPPQYNADEETQLIGFPSEYDEDAERTPSPTARRTGPRVLVPETMAVVAALGDSPTAFRQLAQSSSTRPSSLGERHALQYATFEGQSLVLAGNSTSAFDAETLDANAFSQLQNTYQQSRLSKYGFRSPPPAAATRGSVNRAPVQFRPLADGLCEDLSEDDDEDAAQCETLPHQRAERRDLARMEEQRQAALEANRRQIIGRNSGSAEAEAERPQEVEPEAEQEEASQQQQQVDTQTPPRRPLTRADANSFSSDGGSDPLQWLPKYMSTPSRQLFFPEHA